MLLAETTATWNVVGAKTRLSEVMTRAQHTPQVITWHGKPSVVVVSIDEWQRKTERKGSLVDFLRTSPLVGADLDLQRRQDEPEELAL